MRDKVNDKERLNLMLEAISNIEEFLTGIYSLEAFSDDKMKRHAICYNLQCIGENCYKLSREFIKEHTGRTPKLRGFELLAYSPNINYDDAGFGLIATVVMQALDEAVNLNIIARNPMGSPTYCIGSYILPYSVPSITPVVSVTGWGNQSGCVIRLC